MGFRQIIKCSSGASVARRTMATHVPCKREWLVIAPDEIGAIQRRVNARPQHLKEITPDVESGFLVFGGPYSSEEAIRKGEPAMIGSVLVAVAETKDQVIERLRKDLYTERKVWDWNKVQIYPFNSTVRLAKNA